MQLHDLRAHGEAQADALEGPAATARLLLEGLEDAPLALLGNALARVGDVDLERLLLRHVRGVNSDGTIVSELARVRQQVVEQLRALLPVPRHEGQRLARDVVHQLHGRLQELAAALVHGYPREGHDLVDEGRETHGLRGPGDVRLLHLVPLPLREEHDVGNQVEQPVGAGVDHAELLGHGLARLGVQHGARKTHDAVERAADLVGEHGHEGGLARLDELQLGNLGEVLPDGHEAGGPALLVELRHETHGHLPDLLADLTALLHRDRELHEVGARPQGVNPVRALAFRLGLQALGDLRDVVRELGQGLLQGWPGLVGDEVGKRALVDLLGAEAGEGLQALVPGHDPAL
mmetsp:Transcript_67961/g.212587  ORF Transcript_67961/g.212587 Transcript_67961/m.212587 type:complete len:348 (+) Transcript_67961:1193-2236(+)